METPLPSSNGIPAALLEYDQWLCWREEDRDGNPTKVPIDVHTGGYASTTDSDTWASFESARAHVEDGDGNGVGFVFTDDDPFVGVDLDDCRIPESETAAAWATDIVETLDSFTEVSPSGTGFHVLVRGGLPAERNRTGDVEMYETARFFTVTADHVERTPTEIKERSAELKAVYDEYVAPDAASNETRSESMPTGGAARTLADEKLLSKAENAANGEKFRQLWRGSTTGYESHSEADMALCSLLAFWTGGDAQQMDRLFRDSGLMREKWDDVHYADGSTYGEKTVERAIAGTDEFYDPDGGDATDSGVASDSQPALDPAEVRSREAERAERIEELEQRLSAVLETKNELEAELEQERARRRELEAELEHQDDDDTGLFRWF